MRLSIAWRNIAAEQEVSYEIISWLLQIRKLKDGAIDKKEFMERLKYMKGITYQYFFGSEEALRYLKSV